MFQPEFIWLEVGGRQSNYWLHCYSIKHVGFNLNCTNELFLFCVGNEGKYFRIVGSWSRTIVSVTSLALHQVYVVSRK